MEHSFVQSYKREIDAFLDFARNWPDNCVLLLDTYNTLKSGVSNAITVEREMEKRGQQLTGIRLDISNIRNLV